MIKVTFVTIHPEFVKAYFDFGVFSSAIKKRLATIEVLNLRDFATDKHGSVDDTPYGGGDSMVMRPEPLKAALQTISSPYVLMPSAGGKPWTADLAKNTIAKNNHVVIICGRFAGIDQRFVDLYVDQEVSFGDFVISGGELPGLMMVDSCLRLIPGVLGNDQSALDDSFGDGMNGLLEYPIYTKPQVFEGVKVPEVLLSGNHQKIERWRKQQALEKTKRNRPDLLKD